MTYTDLGGKAVKARSRGGCTSCKRLRIKCDETKPVCEYCRYTDRECTYPEVKILKREVARIRRIEKLKLLSQNGATNAILSGIDHYEVKGDELARELVLTQSTNMLGISKFELRLLQFFDQECIQLFSYGVDHEVDKVMKNKIPYLFLQSDLVRKSMFCISAMALSSIMDLEMLQRIDMEDDRRSQENIYNINVLDPNSLYSKNIEYFLDAIGHTRRLIGSGDDGREMSVLSNLENLAVGKELAVSSILLFCYMGLNPHKIIPLIDFTKQIPDLVQIAKGMAAALRRWIPPVMKSEVGPLLGHQPLITTNTPVLKLCTYPVIVDLKRGLEDFYSTSEVSLEIYEEIATLEETMNLLIASIHSCILSKLPLPLYRLLFLLTDNFRDLLYKKHKYALRVFFVFASLCAISKCRFKAPTNVWIEHMRWYKEEGYLTNEMDKRLYDLVIIEDFGWVNYFEFHTLDPYRT